MLRMLAILSCVGLLIQAAVMMVYQGGPVDMPQTMFVGLLFLAPALSLVSLLRRTAGGGLFSDWVARVRAEEALRREKAMRALRDLDSDRPRT